MSPADEVVQKWSDGQRGRIDLPILHGIAADFAGHAFGMTIEL
jgi:hypothetical protein